MNDAAVIHAGIYYTPKSLKAKFCVTGKRLLYDYVCSNGIAHRRTGKLIVCTNNGQLSELEALHQRAHQNGVTDCVLMSRADCVAMEPHVSAVAGMFSPSTGIVDSHGLLESLLGELQQVFPPTFGTAVANLLR
jgi:L-2-hydroxyglutarate oxidase LhgO